MTRLQIVEAIGGIVIGALLVMGSVVAKRKQTGKYSPFVMMCCGLSFFLFTLVTLFDRSPVHDSQSNSEWFDTYWRWAGPCAFLWLAIIQYKKNPASKNWRIYLIVAAFFTVFAWFRW
jgi:hypothetical protein